MTKTQKTTEAVSGTKTGINVMHNVEEFGRYIGKSVDNWRQACKIYHDTLDYDFTSERVFQARYPAITPVMFDRMYRVGAGELLPHLALLGSDRVVKKLMLLPVHAQERHFSSEKSMVTVVVGSGVAVKRRADELTEYEADRLVDAATGTLRDTEQQRELHRQQQTKRLAKASSRLAIKKAAMKQAAANKGQTTAVTPVPLSAAEATKADSAFFLDVEKGMLRVKRACAISFADVTNIQRNIELLSK